MTVGGRNKRAGKAGKQGDLRFVGVRNPLVRAFAERLIRWRQEQHLTLKNVADDLGVSVSIVCEWEHGRRFPSADHFLAIARYTGVPAWGFLRYANELGQEPQRKASR